MYKADEKSMNTEGKIIKGFSLKGAMEMRKGDIQVFSDALIYIFNIAFLKSLFFFKHVMQSQPRDDSPIDSS